jgi:hypothetical protein
MVGKPEWAVRAVECELGLGETCVLFQPCNTHDRLTAEYHRETLLRAGALPPKSAPAREPWRL